LLTSDSATLELVNAIGYPPESLAGWRYFPVTAPVPLAEAVRTGEPVWVETVAMLAARYPRFAAGSRFTFNGAWAAIPFVIRGQAVGALGLSFGTAQDFGAEDRVFMVTLAQECAQALERARLFEAEQRARAEAQEAARLRDEFLGIASHELKTPLTTVKGYVQLLGRYLTQSELDRVQLAAVQRPLQRQISHLEGLVADLLDTARIQQGRVQLQRQMVDLVALAHEVLARFEHAPERTPRHSLALHAPAPVAGLWDGDRLDQVLTNLVSNALKYSPDGGEVRVRIGQAGAQAELAVGDQGLGIPPAEQVRLFQPFSRSTTIGRSISGAGLGLYITAQIVERHGGTIAVQSTPGTGSTFTVRLPLAPPAG
jgi:signal transduction histidine kinase